MKVAIYGRVSTKDRQEVENQLAELRDYCRKNSHDIYREYIDRESGSKTDREYFRAMFQEAHQRKFDVVLFWALDRFSREGSRQTIKYLAQLEDYGIGFISYKEEFLNSTGIFKDMIISLLATLAKQESVRISERVKAGLALARERGKRLGRRSKINSKLLRTIHHMRGQDMSLRQIATATGVSKSLVHKALKSSGQKTLDNSISENQEITVS